MRPPNGKVFIYALCHPETKEIRYVGKTKRDLRVRLNAHLCEKGDTRKVRWVAVLKETGLIPEVLILEVADEEQWETRECYWIAFYRELGCDLTNLTDGGDGTHNLVEEARQRLSETRKQMFADPEFKARMTEVARDTVRRAKISQGLLGRSHSSEHVAKLPQNQPGRKLTEEHKKKIVAGLEGKKYPGKKVSPITLEMARIANIGNQHTKGRIMPEHERIHRSLANQGQKRSEETRKRQSVARSLYWERKRQEKDNDITVHGLREPQSDNTSNGTDSGFSVGYGDNRVNDFFAASGFQEVLNDG